MQYGTYPCAYNSNNIPNTLQLKASPLLHSGQRVTTGVFRFEVTVSRVPRHAAHSTRCTPHKIKTAHSIRDSHHTAYKSHSTAHTTTLNSGLNWAGLNVSSSVSGSPEARACVAYGRHHPQDRQARPELGAAWDDASLHRRQVGGRVRAVLCCWCTAAAAVLCCCTNAR